MKKDALIMLLILVLMVQRKSPAIFYAAASDDQVTPAQMQRYIVGFIGTPDPEVITDIDGQVLHVFHLIRAISASLTPEMAETLRGMTLIIEYVEDDLIAQNCTEELPWGVDRIDAEKVHSYNKGTGVKVAVLDTGIDTDHEDLMSNYKGGIDIVNDDNNPEDDQGHGTHVSGTIAAAKNEKGVIGVAPEAYLYAVKVLNSAGSGQYSWIAEGIEWAVDNLMKIISMSLGGSGNSKALEDACQEAYSRGILLVAAAGNTGGAVLYPAKYPSVIAVSAMDSSDNIASFSSRGPEVELSAPGVNVESTTIGGGYGSKSGTSMACPHVTGTAALVWFAYPSKTNDQVRQILRNNAEDLGASGKDDLYGYGLVDAERSAPRPGPGVGGVVVAVDKFGLLAPYIGVASTILVAAAATAIYAKRVKRRKDKQ